MASGAGGDRHIARELDLGMERLEVTGLADAKGGVFIGAQRSGEGAEVAPDQLTVSIFGGIDRDAVMFFVLDQNLPGLARQDSWRDGDVAGGAAFLIQALAALIAIGNRIDGADTGIAVANWAGDDGWFEPLGTAPAEPETDHKCEQKAEDGAGGAVRQSDHRVLYNWDWETDVSGWGDGPGL